LPHCSPSALLIPDRRDRVFLSFCRERDMCNKLFF
jgi:hypothetical protein